MWVTWLSISTLYYSVGLLLRVLRDFVAKLLSKSRFWHEVLYWESNEVSAEHLYKAQTNVLCLGKSLLNIMDVYI